MWFFDWFQTYFTSLKTYFQNVSNAIYSVPVLGAYLSYPFAWIASFFANLSTASLYASSWSDSIAATASAAYTNGLNAFNYAYGWLTSSVNSLTSQVSFLSSSLSGWVTTSLNSLRDLVNAVSGAVNGWITTAIGSLWSSLSAISGAISDVSKGLASSVWSWITSGHLQVWLNGAGYTLQSGIIGIVEGSLAYLVSRATEVFADNVESFEGFLVWFADTLIFLVGDTASYFADSLWWLFERIIAELSQWEG
jgi:hypothetical protein